MRCLYLSAFVTSSVLYNSGMLLATHERGSVGYRPSEPLTVKLPRLSTMQLKLGDAERRPAFEAS